MAGCQLFSIQIINKMLNKLKQIFGFGSTVDYAALIKQGGIILDVRSKVEYASGHIEGSINIPVDILKNSLSQLKDKNKPIITCCASGMRSARAKNILKTHGYTDVHNGDGWRSLQSKI